MIDFESAFGRAISQQLEAQYVIWLTTVDARLTPQPRPVWFIWQEDSFLIFSQAKAHKLKHIARHPRVALHFNTDERANKHIMIFTGEAILNDSGEWLKGWAKIGSMMKCPYCQATTRQNKAGKTDAGSQRYRCMHCQRKYTPEPKPQGYPASQRQQAVEMYVDGLNLRKIARHLKVHHRTVALWVADRAETLPRAPVPQEVKEAEMDELYTFIGDKKTKSTF